MTTELKLDAGRELIMHSLTARELIDELSKFADDTSVIFAAKGHVDLDAYAVAAVRAPHATEQLHADPRGDVRLVSLPRECDAHPRVVILLAHEASGITELAAS